MSLSLNKSEKSGLFFIARMFMLLQVGRDKN